VRWAESHKGSVLFNVGPFEVGHVIGAGFKVAVELVFIGWRYKTFEDGVDEGPEVTWVVWGPLEELLSPDCKFIIFFSTKEPAKAV